MRRIPWALGLSASLVACEGSAPAPGDAEGAFTAPAPASSLSPWSARAPAGSAAPGEADAAVPGRVDPAALEELLAAAPKEPPRSTGEDGGTTVGTVTGEGDAGAPNGADGGRKPVITMGMAELQPKMSSAAVERSGRQQLYWSLVTRCKDKEGKILPPDAVTLVFLIDPDGYITPSTIVASAADPRFEDAARCMRRELSAATFRAPASGRGTSTHVTATVPSVD